MNCICCGSSVGDSPYRDEYAGNFLQFCSTCGHMQLQEIPTEDAIRAYYESDYAARRRAALNESYFRIMRKRAAAQCSFITEKVALDGLSICDVGCGYGFLLAGFERMAADVLGVEYDPEAIDYCRRHGHRVAVLRDARELLPTGDFDLVSLSHVLEHFIDPVAVLGHISRVSRYIFIEIPVYDCRIPEQFLAKEGHINFFTPRSFEHLLSRAGLVACRMGRYGPGMHLFWRQSMRHFRRFLQSATGDYFMNRYDRLNPGGIWIRALIVKQPDQG